MYKKAKKDCKYWCCWICNKKIWEHKKVKNDYLMIEYAEDGKLYVPVEKVYVLQKYLYQIVLNI